MVNVKEKIIREIQDISDETLLNEVYQLLQQLQSFGKEIELNDEQKADIREARADYKSKRFHSTEDTFRDLSDE